MTKKIFKISGMHCSSCALSIDMDLEDLDGVLSSKTSYVKQVLEVEFDETKLQMQRIIDQVKKAGYRVIG